MAFSHLSRSSEILSQVTSHQVRTQPVLVFAGKWWIDDTRPKNMKDQIWVLNDASVAKWIDNTEKRNTRDTILANEKIALYSSRLRKYVNQEVC